MRDLALEASRGESQQPASRQGPQFWENIVLDEHHVLRLGVEARDEAELALCAAVRLGFIERFLVDFVLEGFRGAGFAEDAVLAQREEGFEDVLANAETEDELLPWEAGAVEEDGEALDRLAYKHGACECVAYPGECTNLGDERCHG